MQKNVLEYLERSADYLPDKIAFADIEKNMSYKNLLDTSKKIASSIHDKIGDKIRKPIMVLTDRNIESIVAFLGSIYSGNFYVPVDKTLPYKRIQQMIETIKPVCIINTDSNNKVKDLFYDCMVINYKDCLKVDINNEYIEKIRKISLDKDPLYAMFTSGSTGVPKAVLISHLSVIDLIDNFKKEFNFSKDNIFGNQAPFDFDVSTKDIYSTLKNTATMFIIPKVYFVSPAKLVPYLNENRINTVIWATSAIRLIENYNSKTK
jgi:non-ribosomal peptide synthetase component F